MLLQCKRIVKISAPKDLLKDPPTHKRLPPIAQPFLEIGTHQDPIDFSTAQELSKNLTFLSHRISEKFDTMPEWRGLGRVAGLKTDLYNFRVKKQYTRVCPFLQ